MSGLYFSLLLFLTYLIIFPAISFIAIIIGVVFFQKEYTARFVERADVAFTRDTYRNRILWVFVAMIAIVLVAIISVTVLTIAGEVVLAEQTPRVLSLVQMAAYGAMANFSAKRLRGMGLSRFWALFCMVPFVFAILVGWLMLSVYTRPGADGSKYIWR